MDIFDIVMLLVMIPGVALTIWAVGRLGSAGYKGIKGKEDIEKDERKEMRNYFLKHDDYVMDDDTYLRKAEAMARDYTETNAMVKLGLDEKEKYSRLSWKSWNIAGNLARNTKKGTVSSRLEIINCFLSSECLNLYRASIQTDSGIADEKTLSFRKNDIREIKDEKKDEYGLGEDGKDIKANVRYMLIVHPYGEEKIGIPCGSSGDEILSAMNCWLG